MAVLAIFYLVEKRKNNIMTYEKLTKSDGKEYYLVPVEEMDIKPLTANSEKQYDFVCPNSGEGFMEGEAYWYVNSVVSDLNVVKSIISVDFYKFFSPNFARFHTRESAIKWNQEKFGKK